VVVSRPWEFGLDTSLMFLDTAMEHLAVHCAADLHVSAEIPMLHLITTFVWIVEFIISHLASK